MTRHTAPSGPTVRDELLTASGGIVAVHDADGVLARLSTAALTDVPAGLVAFQVRPGTRRASWLAADLHAALGADADLTGSGRPGDGDWTLVTVATLAQRIGHIVVLDAWLLTPPLLGALIANLQATGAALWLVGRGVFSDDQRDVVGDWVADITDPATFLTAWGDRPDLLPEPGTPPTAGPPTAPQVPEPVAWDDRWPHHLPDTDFTTFRAACRNLLTAEQFTAVDDHLVATARSARAWLAGHLTRHTPTDEDALARHLHQVWQDSPTVPHFQVAVRAHQVAAFSLGWFLQVDLDQLLGTAAVSPRRAARTPTLWARLSRYTSAHRGAICALTASGIDIADQLEIPVEAVTNAGRVLVLPNGRRVLIEDGAHHYLYAQQLTRLLHGAAGDDPLLAGPAGEPLAERAVANVLLTARLELGLNLTGPRMERRSPTGDRWTTRWGVSIQELP